MSSSNYANQMTRLAEKPAERAVGAAMGTGMAWLDMMMRLQRASLQSFSSYSPTSDTRISGSLPQQTAGVAVIPVGEERLNVATRTVLGETTRIRRRVVAQPVEQEITLREETVVVERRHPAQQAAVPGVPPRQDVLTETVIEMSDSRQVPTVWKSIHVAEEVVLRKQVTERKEMVRETVRRDVVEVEHAAVEHEAAERPALAHDGDEEGAAARLGKEVQEAGERQGQAVKDEAERIQRAAQAEMGRARAETQAAAARQQAEVAAAADRRPGAPQPVPPRKA